MQTALNDLFEIHYAVFWACHWKFIQFRLAKTSLHGWILSNMQVRGSPTPLDPRLRARKNVHVVHTLVARERVHAPAVCAGAPCFAGAALSRRVRRRRITPGHGVHVVAQDREASSVYLAFPAVRSAGASAGSLWALTPPIRGRSNASGRSILSVRRVGLT